MASNLLVMASLVPCHFGLVLFAVPLGLHGIIEVRFERKATRGLLGTRSKKLLGAPGIATSNKKLLGAPGLTTRSKDATRSMREPPSFSVWPPHSDTLEEGAA